MPDLMTAKEAADFLGGKVSAQCIREHVKRGDIDIGVVLPPLQGTRKRYMVSKEKLCKWIGIEDRLKQEHPVAGQPV